VPIHPTWIPLDQTLPHAPRTWLYPVFPSWVACLDNALEHTKAFTSIIPAFSWWQLHDITHFWCSRSTLACNAGHAEPPGPSQSDRLHVGSRRGTAGHTSVFIPLIYQIRRSGLVLWYPGQVLNTRSLPAFGRLVVCSEAVVTRCASSWRSRLWAGGSSKERMTLRHWRVGVFVVLDSV
jgi:hypothetical protein